jgi:hypothetical protein
VRAFAIVPRAFILQKASLSQHEADLHVASARAELEVSTAGTCNFTTVCALHSVFSPDLTALTCLRTSLCMWFVQARLKEGALISARLRADIAAGKRDRAAMEQASRPANLTTCNLILSNPDRVAAKASRTDYAYIHAACPHAGSS